MASALFWPAILVARVARTPRALMARVSAQYGLNHTRQYLGMLKHGLASNLPPTAYYKYQLFRQHDISRPVWSYIHDHELHLLLRAIRRDRAQQAHVIDDKALFLARCAQHALPNPGYILRASRGQIQWSDQECSLPREDLVIKATGLAMGVGFELWRYLPQSDAWVHANDTRNPEQLIAHLKQRSTDGDIIAQIRLRNHPQIRRFSREGLSTIRVLTARSTTGPACVIAATMKMPVGGSIVDNMNSGGIASTICLTTGRMNAAGSKRVQDGWHDTHPDSGALIQGHEVPGLRHAVDICLQAHTCFGDYPAIGWDVAITESGPTLIEANTLWGQELHQELPGGSGLGQTLLAEVMLDELRRTQGP